MLFRVFVENEAGCAIKNHHNERTLMFERAETVSRAYPYPYGFIIGTANADDDCLDCFVITERALRTGEIVECEAIGLMEQSEDGLTDNNVLAKLAEEQPAVTPVVRSTVTTFVQNVFSHIPGKTIGVGRFLGVNEAEAEITKCRVHVEVREEPISTLPLHAQIPIAFMVKSVFDVSSRSEGVFDLVERAILVSYVKDYDAVEPPAEWAARFELTKWGLFAAYRDGMRVGGAVVAFDTPAVDLLEGRTNLAVLWDIRVQPDTRDQGVGSLLFRAAERWAFGRGCTQIKIETQNVNVAACRFYEHQGCVLRAAKRGAYEALPDELQLLWYKDLQ